MKKIQLILLSVAITAIIAACGGGHSQEGNDHHGSGAMDSTQMEVHGMGMEYTSTYVCPMHHKSSGSEQPGKCPVCGMDYVKHAEHVKDGHKH